VEVIGSRCDWFVARKNYHRVIYGMSNINLTKPGTVKTMHKFEASLAVDH
jgi:hypothetical protein